MTGSSPSSSHPSSSSQDRPSSSLSSPSSSSFPASADPAPYRHTPFPDVSGLRTDALGRTGWVEAGSKDLSSLIQTASSIEEAADWQSGTLLAAAWAVILLHYVHQEETDIAFQTSTRRGLAAVVRLCGPDVKGWSSEDLCAQVSAQLEGPRRLEEEAALDTGVVYDAEREGDYTLAADKAVTLLASSERIVLRATARVHSEQSAFLQLRQVETYLRSFIDDLRLAKSSTDHYISRSACDAGRLPYELCAGDNPDPQQVSSPDDLPQSKELFHCQFERQVLANPSSIALDFRFDLSPSSSRNVRWSYAELDRRARLVQREIMLAEPELSADAIIALCLVKSPELYVAQLGTLKAGAAFCPIDPNWPEQRQQALLVKSGAKVLLAAGDPVCQILESIRPVHMRLVRLDRLDWGANNDSSNEPAADARRAQTITSSCLAYKIWTSGTTGLPKAVGIEHSAAVQALRSLQKVIPHDGADIRYLQFSAYVFDLSILDCFYTWGLGGTLCSASHALLLGDLAGIANACQASHSLLTPAVMAMTPRESIPSLKVVINGGEKLTQVVADMWSVDCCLLNLYGPAEATLIAMHRRVPAGDSVRAPNIGVALPTVSCHALDQAGSVVPKGAIGQLALGGFQCARGYLGDAEKTADKFHILPKLGRVYLTGDLVRQLADQSFEYLGREDDQIKINGIRIETLEISAVIKNSHPDIKDSETQAIALDDDPSGQLRIVSFSVLPDARDRSKTLLRVDEDAATAARALRLAAQKALPSYMVPSLFLIVSRFPRTSSAKIDRAALKSALKHLDILQWEAAISGEEGASNADGSNEDGALSSEAESVIRGLVSELCNIKADRIGRTTPFPSLGLDSIKAMVLARKLSNAGFTTSVIDIVEHANVATLARKVSPVGDKPSSDDRDQLGATFLADFDSRYRSTVARELRVESSLIESIAPPTPLQEGMLAETLRDLDQGSYWLNRKYSVASGVDSFALKQAIKDFVADTPGCRVTFCSNPDTESRSDDASNYAFVQVVRKDLAANVSIVDLSADYASHDQGLLSAAKSLTGSNPISEKCPLAFVIGCTEAGTSRYLLLRAHHSIYDARSLELFEEIVAVHLSGQQTRSLPSLTTALPSILSLTSEEEARRRDTWERALQGVPTPPNALTFPELSGQALQRGGAASSSFEHVSTTSSITWSDLSRTAQDMGTSARPIAQCAWASILAAYLETDSILLGDSISGRAIGPNMDNVFGPLHATVPVPIAVQAGLTRRAMVDQVDEFHKAVLHHQHVPLSFVRRVLEMRPDETLFQSVFVFEPSSGAQTRQSVLSDSKDLELSVEHPLAVEVSTDETGRIFLGIVYRGDLMSSEQARAMLAQYDASLASFCSHPDAAPQDWSSDAFRTVLSGGLLSVSSPRPSDWIDKAISMSAETWLTDTASQYPDRPALEFWSSLEPSAMPDVLSYQALSDKVGRMAAFLTDKARPKSIVAVCLSRCVMTYVSLLAIQQAGLVYLPVDENLPAERQELLVKESGAALVLADDESLVHFKMCSASVFDVHSIDLAPYSGLEQYVDASSSDLSYVLYTSGSTGKPKGCKITRSNLSVNIEAFRLTFEAEAPGSFESGARFLARSAEAFDVALLEVFLPLRTASTIVTGPRSLILEDLRKAMSTMRVTHAAVVPSLFYSEGSRIRPVQLPDLRALIVGGEKIPTDIVELWGGSNVPTLNAYGPTEATIGNSIARVRPGSSTRNIGRAFPGSQYAIMIETSDGRLQPALRGQAGELCVLGPQVGDGYLGQRESPTFTLHEGQRMYRTGDLARMTVDEEALYLGRIDASQVKIRGARLELSEVDAVLLGSVTEQDLHVATIHLQSKDQLVTFVARTARASALPDGEDALDRSLIDVTKAMWKKARSLPSHMRPAAIVPLATLPLAVISGKVDQQALRSVFERLGSYVDVQGDGSDAADSRPLSKREALVVEELLRLVPAASKGQASPSPSSDLFALGLDSLLAVRLSGRLRQRGLHITVSRLLSSVGIEDAAKESQQDTQPLQFAAEPQPTGLTARARELSLLSPDHEGIFHCTALQESLLAETLSHSSTADERLPYISTIEVALADTVDEVELVRAIDEAIAAHPIWRTAFVEIDGRICQLVSSTASPSLWVPETQRLEGRTLVDSISAVAPIRLQIRRDATRPTQLAILAHHSLYDGVSLDLFLKDVDLRYARKAVPDRRPFSEVAEFVNSHDEEASKRFWLSQLEDSVLAPFPSLNPLQCDLSTERREVLMSSSTSLARLSELARKLGVTQQALLISAWARLLDQFTGETDSLFGLILSGRSIDIEDAEHIQGPFITTVPFCTQTPERKGDNDKTRVQAIHRRLLHMYDYQHTSLRKIGQWLQSDAPLFNVLFSFLAPPSKSAAFSIFLDTTTSMQTEYPLAVEVQPQLDDSIQMRLAYDPHFIPNDQANLLLLQLDDEIRRFLASVAPQFHVESPSLLSISNPDPYDPSKEDHFLHRFSQQVERRPHAVSVDYAASGLDSPWDTLTYQQLDRLSDQIAAKILEHHSGGIVAVYMQRSLTFYAALLAVWKADKTYLPLDPSLPLERLKYMLEVAEVSTIATDDACYKQAQTLGSNVILMQSHARDTYASHPTMPAPCLDLTRPAYILFTSGSTGKPKGVPISHRALAAAVASWESILPHQDDSRMLQLASASFDVSLIEICLPWAFGCAVVSAPKDVLLDDLEETFRKLRVTMADLPSSLAPTVHPENIPRLEWLMSGGDAIDERVLREWGSHALINAWGPTETTIGNALGFVSNHSKRSIVGKAWPGSTVYVLCQDSVDIAYRGCVGELAVAGPQLSDGYLARPDLTAAAFVALADGTRVYRTGDRGRMLADGQIEVLGRISRGQVKLRGQRLELQEVSHAILSASQGQLQNADTLFLQHPKLPAKQLVTWVALSDSKTSETVSLRRDTRAQSVLAGSLQELSRRLPPYMVPSHLLATRGTLPLTSNNKIDHSALERAFMGLDLTELQSQQNHTDGKEAEQAWTEQEQGLLHIVADFCKLDPKDVSRTTSFYRLGIDSLSAIRLSRSMRQSHAFAHVSAKDVLRWPSIALLAANAARQEQGTQITPSLVDQRVATAKQIDADALLLSADDAIQSVLPCTPLQEGTIAQTLATEGRLYFHHHAYRVQDADVQVVSNAWQLLIERTDILRTTFHRAREGTSWVQAVHKQMPPSQLFQVQDGPFGQAWDALVASPLTVTEEDFARTIARLTVVEDADVRHVVLSLHHALYDGNALPKLVGDLDLAIRGQSLPKRLPFLHLAPHLLPKRSNTEYWCEHLRGYIPAALSRAADSHEAGACEAKETITLPLEEARSLARGLAVSLRTAAVASYAKALCHLSASRDIVFGQIVALRDSIEGADEVIGPAFNTVPTRVRWTSFETAGDVLKKVQQESDAGQAHLEVSLREVQVELSLAAPPFDALMDYQIQEGERDTLLSLSPAGPPAEPSIQYAVNLEWRQTGDGLSLYATADCTVLSLIELQAFLTRVANIFQASLLHPDAPAAEPSEKLPPMSDADTKTTSSVNQTSQVPDADAKDRPWSDLELKLRQHVLTVTNASEDRLQVGTSFTSLGVDSITAIYLASLIRKGGSPVAVSDIVKGGNIRGLAKRIEARLSSEEGESRAMSTQWQESARVNEVVCSKLRVDSEQIERVLPALPGQTFQLASWLNSGKRLGIYSWTWMLEGHTDEGRMKRAWHSMVDRHPTLRTTFAVVDGEVYQIVLKHQYVDLGIVFEDVEHSASLEDVGRERLRELAAMSQDMRRQPVKLEVLSQEARSLIILNLSHALYDAWSIELIAEDLQRLYRQEEPIANAAFSDFAARHAALSPQATSKARDFWQTELRGVEPALLSGRQAAASHRDVMVYVPQAAQLAKAYEHARAKRTHDPLPSLQALFVASWSLELSALTGKARPLFGLYQSGRSDDFPAIERLAGPCLTVLPLVAGKETQSGVDDGGISSSSSFIALARDLEEAVARRSEIEQSADLRTIHAWAAEVNPTPGLKGEREGEGDGVSGPLFDTYLNLIWGSSTPQASTAECNAPAAVTFVPIKLGTPTDFAPPPPPLSGGATSGGEESVSTIDDLSAAHRSCVRPRVEVDVILQDDGDWIGVGVNCEAGVLVRRHEDGQQQKGEEEEVRRLIQRLVGRVKKCIEELQVD